MRTAFAPARELEPTDVEIAAILVRAGRPGRRTPHKRRVLALALVAALLAVGGAGAATGFLPIGTEVPTVRVPGKGEPVYESDRVVIATGQTQTAGRWQASVTTSDQGLCFSLELIDAYPDTRSERCGGTANGFDVASVGGGDRLRDTTIVYGGAPEQATAVRARSADGFQRTVATEEGPDAFQGDFYVLEIPRRLRNVEVSWLDGRGRTERPGLLVPSSIAYGGRQEAPKSPH